MSALIRSSLLLLAPLAALLLLLELVAWLAGVEPVAQRPKFPTDIIRNNLRWGDPGKDCAPEPLAGTSAGRRLVVALGGSSVEGYPRQVPFPAQLARLLESRRPGVFAVANRGRNGKDSIYVRRCVEELITSEPDVLVLYTGHNDVGNWGLSDPARMIRLEENAWLLDLRDALEWSRAFSFLARRLGRSSDAARNRDEVGMPPQAEREAALSASRETILATYRSNLEAVIALALAHASEVILVTVAGNLHDFPDADDAPRARFMPEFAGPFAEGRRLHGEGRYAEALAALKRARDVLPLGRAFGAQNQVIRELAAEHAHVRLVDFEALLDRAGGAEGVGCNFFGDERYCDQFHPNTRAHGLLARALAEELMTREEPR